MNAGLRIAVTGLAGTYPFGGVFWDYLQYAVGLRRLGHDVLYLEDTGKWCYDPQVATFTDNGRRNATLLGERIARIDPGLRWFFRDAAGRCYGCAWQDVVAFCRHADLFLHVSASCWMREEYFAARHVAFVDSDPMYTQASVNGYVEGTIDDLGRSRIDELRRHDVFFTFAENIGAPDCRVPTALFDWMPTRQPIVLDLLAAATVPAERRRAWFTTVGTWDLSGTRPVVDGVHYGGKSAEFRRFLDLPASSPVPLHVAFSGEVPARQLRRKGWVLDDAMTASGEPWAYLDYLAHSLGEWSVAKQAYVASRSGWFSCRSACYLALGVPVVVQDTGFDVAIPSGEGVLTFSTLDQAADAIDRVATKPGLHARAAYQLAAEFFASDRVLRPLLDRALGH
ncbi:MAG: glycosyltransferase [Haloechinothrix sp.]